MKSLNIKKTSIYITLLFAITYLCIKYNIYIPCIFHKITGLYCPGCGITRMIISLLKMNFCQAFRYNPLAFILLPLFICYYIIKYIFYLKNKQLIINNKVWYTILMIVILFGIIRNIPTFKYLIPTKI